LEDYSKISKFILVEKEQKQATSDIKLQQTAGKMPSETKYTSFQ